MKSFTYIINLKDKFTNKIGKIGGASQKVYAKLMVANTNYQQSNDKVGNSIASIKHKLDRLRQKRDISISKKDIRSANVEVRKLEKELHKLENLPPNGFIGRFRKLQTLTGGLGTAVLGAVGGMQLFNGITGIAKLGMDMEQTEVSFETMLGGMDKAKGMIKGLDKFANATPFENDVLYENSKLLLNFGMAGEKVIPTLKMLGDVSGGNKQKLDSLSLAYAQVQSAGKLTGQDLLQMINAGFNPLNEIAKKSGKSMGELKEAMSKGQISAKMVEKAFAGATSKGGRFYKMMEKQSKTAAGKMSTLMGKLKQKGIAIGKAMLPAINWLIDAGLRLVDNISAIYNWYKKYSGIINVVVGGIAIAIAAYQSYLIITNTVKLATMAWTAAQTVLNAVMSLNPVGLIIAGIVLLVAAITYVIMKTDGWAKQWQNFKGMFLAVLDMMGSRFSIIWHSASKKFKDFIDDLVLGWKQAKNLMGLLSDDELANEKSRIKIAKKDRQEAINDAVLRNAKAKKDFADNAKWEIKWNSGKNNNFAKAKNNAMKLFSPGIPGKKSLLNTNTNVSTGNSEKDVKNNITDGITSGGRQQKNITINLGKFQDAINIHSENLQEGVNEMQNIIENALLRILNQANSV